MKKFLKVLFKTVLGIVLGLAAAWLILLAVNFGFTLSLRSYIRSFDPVAYDEASRAVPEYDEDLGHYAVTANEDLKIMMLTDIHIGGGCWTHRKDMKTVYELITMLQNEKPDLVILCGDNTFAVPGPVYNGGGTINNKMAARDVIEIFEHEGVYFSTVFGNHDTEAFGYTDRLHLAKFYDNEKFRYCIFRSEFSDPEVPRPSVTNQFIVVKDSAGAPSGLILLVDTNDYIDGKISSTIGQRYDTIHASQVAWAKEQVQSLSAKAGLPEGEAMKTLCFFHIPFGEYETAYRELTASGFAPTADSEYLQGVWDEIYSENAGGRVMYGGGFRKEDPAAQDLFFETLGPDGLDTLEMCFCGHDHVNNAVVRYKGVVFGYGYSLDNTAYDDIWLHGPQRGCTVFTPDENGQWNFVMKNVYKDCGAETDKFYPVDPDTLLFPGWLPE